MQLSSGPHDETPDDESRQKRLGYTLTRMLHVLNQPQNTDEATKSFIVLNTIENLLMDYPGLNLADIEKALRENSIPLHLIATLVRPNHTALLPNSPIKYPYTIVIGSGERWFATQMMHERNANPKINLQNLEKCGTREVYLSN